MKRILCATAGLMAIAGAANAQDVESLAINGEVAAKCGVYGSTLTVDLPQELTNENAMLRGAVSGEIATALNGARLIAFCNGVGNTVQVERAVLANTDASITDNGSLASGGFAQYVKYELDMSLNGTVLDSTTSATASPANRFGGHNSGSSSATWLQFQAVGNAVPSSNSSNNKFAASGWASLTDRRMAAGNYVGSVRVTVTPGA